MRVSHLTRMVLATVGATTTTTSSKRLLRRPQRKRRRRRRSLTEPGVFWTRRRTHLRTCHISLCTHFSVHLASAPIAAANGVRAICGHAVVGQTASTSELHVVAWLVGRSVGRFVNYWLVGKGISTAPLTGDWRDRGRLNERESAGREKEVWRRWLLGAKLGAFHPHLTPFP